MFKAGDYILCIDGNQHIRVRDNNGWWSSVSCEKHPLKEISIGSIYRVISTTKTSVIIINDIGIKKLYKSSRFKLDITMPRINKINELLDKMKNNE